MSYIHDHRPLRSKISAKKDRSQRENLKQPQTPESSGMLGAVKEREGQLDEPNQINQSLAPEGIQARKYTPGEYYKAHSEARPTSRASDSSQPREQTYSCTRGMERPKRDPRGDDWCGNSVSNTIRREKENPRPRHIIQHPKLTKKDRSPRPKGSLRPPSPPTPPVFTGHKPGVEKGIKPYKKRKNRSRRENLRPPTPPTSLSPHLHHSSPTPPSPPTPISHEGTRYHTLFGNKPTTETTPISRLRM